MSTLSVKHSEKLRLYKVHGNKVIALTTQAAPVKTSLYKDRLY